MDLHKSKNRTKTGQEHLMQPQYNAVWEWMMVENKISIKAKR